MVVAIIAILASLVLPSLARAKKISVSAVCKSNLRQMSHGIRMYISDFGCYPVAVRMNGASSASFGDELLIWPFTLRWYLREGWPLCPDGGSGVILRAGQIGLRILPQYGYNAYGSSGSPSRNLGLGWIEIDAKRTSAFRVSDATVRSPSEMIAMADAPGFNSSVDPRPLTSLPLARHLGKANVLFCDGHIESAKVSRLCAAEPQARRRWNNDNEPHPESW